MYDRFSDRARKAMQLANQEAQRVNSEFIGNHHLLVGLIKSGGIAARVLEEIGVDLTGIRRETQAIVAGPTGSEMVTMGKLPHTPRLKYVVELAIETARDMGHNWVGTEHLLLGLIAEGESPTIQILKNLGAEIVRLRELTVRKMAPHGTQTTENKPNQTGTYSGALLAALQKTPPGDSEEQMRNEVRAIFGVPSTLREEILSHTFVFANGARAVVMAAVDAGGSVTFSIRNLTPPPADEPHVKKS